MTMTRLCPNQFQVQVLETTVAPCESKFAEYAPSPRHPLRQPSTEQKQPLSTPESPSSPSSPSTSCSTEDQRSGSRSSGTRTIPSVPALPQTPRKSSSHNNKKQKKHVTFNGFVGVRPTKHIEDYSRNEINDCWYTTEECNVIRSTAKLIVNCTEEDQSDEDAYCKRGLECLTREGAMHKLQHKHEAWDAVFDEQDLQWEDDVYEPECLAEAYMSVSAEAQEEARARGQKDHLAATAAVAKMQ